MTCRALGWLTACVALVVFVGGWALDVGQLRSVVPGVEATMKALTALGLGAAAVALLLLVDPGSRAKVLTGRALATFTVGVGVAALIEHWLGWDLGIDELLFRDTGGRALGAAHPGRVAPTAGACFVLVGCALLTLDVRPRRRWRPAELLVLPIAALGVATIVGYLYAIPSLYGPGSAANMALHTAVCFVALAVAILLARPHGRLLRLATTDDPGGILVRRMVPLAVALPLLLGWVEEKASQAGLFSERVGTWWLTITISGALTLLIWRVGGRLSHYANGRRELEVELNRLADHDALTGVFNRRRFDEELAAAAARVTRQQAACSVVAIDFDHMKHVNDTLGHAAGDALLRAVGTLLTERIRASDVVARVGGDEFTVLLPATDAADAVVLASALREAVSDCRVISPRGEARTTLSIGVAEITPELPDPERARAAADDNLYVSKQDGGDRVTFVPRLAGGLDSAWLPGPRVSQS